MDRQDELGSTKCHFCPLEVPEDPEAAGWSLVPRYDKKEKRWKGKKYVWRCARCKGISQRNFKDWLYPGEENPQNTFGRRR